MARRRVSLGRIFGNLLLLFFVGGFLATIFGQKALAEWFIVGVIILVIALLPLGMIINAGKPRKKLDYDEDDIREELMQ